MTNQSNDLGSQSAFPVSDTHTDYDMNREPYIRTDISGGLTKRELFAAMAMQGMLARDSHSDLGCAERALAYADALLAALKDVAP